jgi:hypothetical protein
MKYSLLTTITCLTFIASLSTPKLIPAAGFSMPDSVNEVSFRYRTVENLVLLPVTINDSIQVNLILDTGCRNLVLFGKRFTRLFNMHPDRRVQFSGLGSGKPVVGSLSLGNKVAIDAVIGNRIPVVVVPDENLFEAYHHVDGVIGYDIFIKFEVELNLASRRITFRPAHLAELQTGYERIPISIQDALPVIRSTIFFKGREGQACDLIIDTGSSLGLLVKTTDIKGYPSRERKILGRGLNGNISGMKTVADKLLLAHYPISSISAGITYNSFHNHASVGMEVMKDFTVLLNYCKSYIGLKRAS